MRNNNDGRKNSRLGILANLWLAVFLWLRSPLRLKRKAEISRPTHGSGMERIGCLRPTSLRHRLGLFGGAATGAGFLTPACGMHYLAQRSLTKRHALDD